MHNVLILDLNPNYMKNLLFSVFIFLGISAVSQDNQDWILYQSIGGVNVYYQEVNCNAKDIPSQVAYILKVENTNQGAVRVTWETVVWYNYEKQVTGVSEGENVFAFNLQGNASEVGSCEVPFGGLYIFKDFITYVSPTKLTKFELTNIKVENI